MPKVAKYIAGGLKARTVAVMFVNNDFGKGGRDTLTKLLDGSGTKVVADISTDAGQVDFSAAVLKAKQTDADAIFVYTNEEESARALRELRKQGVKKLIIGETTLTGQKVIELAGEAAKTADVSLICESGFGLFSRKMRALGFEPRTYGLKVRCSTD